MQPQDAVVAIPFSRNSSEFAPALFVVRSRGCSRSPIRSEHDGGIGAGGVRIVEVEAAKTIASATRPPDVRLLMAMSLVALVRIGEGENRRRSEAGFERLDIQGGARLRFPGRSHWEGTA
jgi:hypothetical protein